MPFRSGGWSANQSADAGAARHRSVGDAEGDQVSVGRYPVVNVMEAWEMWSMLGILAPGIEHHYHQDNDGRRTA